MGIQHTLSTLAAAGLFLASAGNLHAYSQIIGTEDAAKEHKSRPVWENPHLGEPEVIIRCEPVVSYADAPEWVAARYIGRVIHANPKLNVPDGAIVLLDCFSSSRPVEGTGKTKGYVLPAREKTSWIVLTQPSALHPLTPDLKVWSFWEDNATTHKYAEDLLEFAGEAPAKWAEAREIIRNDQQNATEPTPAPVPAEGVVPDCTPCGIANAHARVNAALETSEGKELALVRFDGQDGWDGLHATEADGGILRWTRVGTVVQTTPGAEGLQGKQLVYHCPAGAAKEDNIVKHEQLVKAGEASWVVFYGDPAATLKTLQDGALSGNHWQPGTAIEGADLNRYMGSLPVAWLDMRETILRGGKKGKAAPQMQKIVIPSAKEGAADEKFEVCLVSLKDSREILAKAAGTSGETLYFPLTGELGDNKGFQVRATTTSDGLFSSISIDKQAYCGTIYLNFPDEEAELTIPAEAVPESLREKDSLIFVLEHVSASPRTREQATCELTRNEAGDFHGVVRHLEPSRAYGVIPFSVEAGTGTQPVGIADAFFGPDGKLDLRWRGLDDSSGVPSNPKAFPTSANKDGTYTIPLGGGLHISLSKNEDIRQDVTLYRRLPDGTKEILAELSVESWNFPYAGKGKDAVYLYDHRRVPVYRLPLK